jgi:cyclopropane fatty-acyl-phospholipid synthase-like methyltransferase
MLAPWGWNMAVERRLEQPDAFYEGRFGGRVSLSARDKENWIGRLKLRTAYFGYLSQILRYVPPGAKVLEIGSAAGMQVLGDTYEVTAIDLSATSLESAPKNYKRLIQANVLEHDFPDGSWDAVISSFFFEHLEPSQKRPFLKKVRNWLRVGGFTTMLYDTLSAAPWFERLRSSPADWQRWFVEEAGHVGLESPKDNFAHFHAALLYEEEALVLNRLLQRPAVYDWSKHFSEHPQLARLAGELSKMTGSEVERWYMLGLYGFDRTVGRLLPSSWGTLTVGTWKRWW